MSGTRTAPAVTGAVTSVNATIHVVDASGDVTTDNLFTISAPTVADIEAWVAAYQVATQGSIWKVTMMNVWEGAKLTSNAETNQRNSVADGINLLYKDVATRATLTPRLVAPVVEVMQGNNDIPDLTDVAMVALLASILTIIPTFSLNSAQYTERKERSNNPRVTN